MMRRTMNMRASVHVCMCACVHVCMHVCIYACCAFCACGVALVPLVVYLRELVGMSTNVHKLAACLLKSGLRYSGSKVVLVQGLPVLGSCVLGLRFRYAGFGGGSY